MAAIPYSATDAPAHSTYSSSVASQFPQDAASFRPMTKSRSGCGSTSSGPYPLSQLYVKYIRRVWKRVSRAARRPERASMLLPDGFVLINNARLGAAARRKSVLLA